MKSELGTKLEADEVDTKVYRIDIPANRYDMLCVEGIARAIKTYLGLGQPPTYQVVAPSGPVQELYVHAETAQVRPYIVAAILRNIEFTKQRYDGFIELQDKLHNNICRKRTLVAIGTHDLDTVQGPFRYEAKTPETIHFAPLNQTKSMSASEVMEFYQSDRKLSKFLHIIKDKPRYPVVYDAQDRVLSLPPIINGDHSKIKLTTKNVLIECTATDITKANVVLNTVVTMFSAYCAKPFTVEPVQVIYKADGKKHTYPQLENRTMTAKFTQVDYINTCVGIDCTADELAKLVGKMSLSAKVSDDKTELVVTIPPTRSDVLHACDIMEDAAIAYNFNKIKETLPRSSTIAVPFPINKLGDMLRKECAYAGFTEVLAFTLCSHDENFKFLNKPDQKEAVVLANPKTQEYQAVSSNKHAALPLKLFEVSDIVLRDETVERRARNQRNLCVLYCDKTSGFEEIRGMVDRLMELLNVKRVAQGTKGGFYIKESSNATFFEGRCADVYYDDAVVGTCGIVHPTVLQNFEIGMPCSALELNIEPFL
ncbi:hypothetical protein HDU91_007156 [Kappamyces sp. JEL0680]|nr:hypothetical protein HDU91_007156 [Kappamyces sp. JEL0680]